MFGWCSQVQIHYLNCLDQEYFAIKSFWIVKANAYSSWHWKKLLKLRPLFRTMLKHHIGNGQNTFLWYDNGHPTGPLLLVYNPIIVYDASLPLNPNASIVINGLERNWPPARSNDLLEVQVQICDNIFPKHTDDIIFWLYSKSRKLHVGETWNWIRQ